jgi:hypothetical protein
MIGLKSDFPPVIPVDRPQRETAGNGLNTPVFELNGPLPRPKYTPLVGQCNHLIHHILGGKKILQKFTQTLFPRKIGDIFGAIRKKTVSCSQP